MDDRDDIDDEHSSQAKIVDFSPRGGEESLVEALSCLPSPDDPDVARQQIFSIASLFNYYSYEEKNSPTRSQMRIQISELRQAAKKLSLAIDKIHELTEERLYFYVRLDRRAIDLDSLAEVLSALQKCSSEAVSDLQGDARGEHNEWRKRYKAPKWWLAAQCGELLYDNGALPTGHAEPDRDNPESGRFARLVQAVYEYATGEESTSQGAGLEYYIKKIGPLFRRRLEIFEKQFEASGGMPIGPFSPGSEYFGEEAEINSQLHDPVMPPIPAEWLLEEADED